MATKTPEFQAPLPGGKRFVKYRVLSAPEVSALEEAAGREVFARHGDQATNADVFRARLTRGLAAMVVGVADAVEKDQPPQPGTKDAPQKKKVPGQWQLLSAMDLATENGPRSIPALFNAKEVKFLEALYSREHDISKEELDALLGKVEPAIAD